MQSFADGKAGVRAKPPLISDEYLGLIRSSGAHQRYLATESAAQRSNSTFNRAAGAAHQNRNATIISISSAADHQPGRPPVQRSRDGGAVDGFHVSTHLNGGQNPGQPLWAGVKPVETLHRAEGPDRQAVVQGPRRSTHITECVVGVGW